MPNEVNILPPLSGEVVRQAPPIHTYFRDTFSQHQDLLHRRVDIDLVKGRPPAWPPSVHPRVGGRCSRPTALRRGFKPPLISPTTTTADQHRPACRRGGPVQRA